MPKRATGKRDEFIEAYWANGGRTDITAKKLDIPVATAYSWFKKKEFRAQISARKSVWVEALRSAAFQRAMTKSDTLLRFLLETLEPAVYDENYRKYKWAANAGLNPDGSSAHPTTVVLIRDDAPHEKGAPYSDPLPEEPLEQ
jgi:hypothetical protein